MLQVNHIIHPITLQCTGDNSDDDAGNTLKKMMIMTGKCHVATRVGDDDACNVLIMVMMTMSMMMLEML